MKHNPVKQELRPKGRCLVSFAGGGRRLGIEYVDGLLGVAVVGAPCGVNLQTNILESAVRTEPLATVFRSADERERRTYKMLGTSTRRRTG